MKREYNKILKKLEQRIKDYGNKIVRKNIGYFLPTHEENFYVADKVDLYYMKTIGKRKVFVAFNIELNPTEENYKKAAIQLYKTEHFFKFKYEADKVHLLYVTPDKIQRITR